MARRMNASAITLLGIGGLFVAYTFRDRLGFSANEEPSLLGKLVSKLRGTASVPEEAGDSVNPEDVVSKFRPSDLEQVDVERTGITVDVIPVLPSSRRTSAQRGADFLVKSMQTPVVNDGPFGPGVSDVGIAQVNPYNYNLDAEDFLGFNATAVGQEITNPKVKGMATHLPKCCYPNDYPDIASRDIKLDDVEGAINRKGDLARLSHANKTMHDTLPPDLNDAYSDGTSTMTLSQWMTTHQVERISDTQVRAIAISGGQDALLRRV
tara:strand:- start:748 stop:1545 length:798 start_codon:yes stop_codon:yes gene_type:complete